MSKFKVGQRVQFLGSHPYVRAHYPNDAKYIGKAGVVEEAGGFATVRMSDGYKLSGWPDDQYDEAVGQFEVGQKVRVTKASTPRGPNVGDLGTVERSRRSLVTGVRLTTGIRAGMYTVISNDRIEAYAPNNEPATVHVLLLTEGEETPHPTKHADLEAALKWLRDNQINGRFEVLYVTKGDTYEASTEVRRV